MHQVGVYAVPYLFTAVVFGAEFPSLLGGLIGLGLVITGARKKLFLPRDTWEFADRAHWEKEWLEDIEPGSNNLTPKSRGCFIPRTPAARPSPPLAAMWRKMPAVEDF